MSRAAGGAACRAADTVHAQTWGSSSPPPPPADAAAAVCGGSPCHSASVTAGGVRHASSLVGPRTTGVTVQLGSLRVTRGRLSFVRRRDHGAWSSAVGCGPRPGGLSRPAPRRLPQQSPDAHQAVVAWSRHTVYVRGRIPRVVGHPVALWAWLVVRRPVDGLLPMLNEVSVAGR